MRSSTLKIVLCFLFTLTSPLLFAQERSVSGKVTDSDKGDGLPGVSVLLKGTSTGTSTDVNGNFTLPITGNNARLVISYVGYASQEIPVTNQTNLTIALKPDIKALEEVVVVGFGTQKKGDLTGAVGGIRGDDIGITSKPVSSPDQILAGRASGVSIANRSGDPGAPINVRIRGIGSPGVNQPLWVIDGVPIVQTENMTVNTGSNTESNPLAGINPSDIESIDVLKDASAAAIYGARAANGVIIVTTKRGKDGKASFTYDGYVGKGSTQKRLDVLNVEQYIDLQQELGRDFSQFRGQPFVDWQDAVFRTSTIINHNIAVSGGSPTANYFVGAGYYDQDGIEPAQGFTRYSIKANSDVSVGKKLKFGESLLLSSVNRLTQSESGSFAGIGAADNAPYFKIYDPNGPLGYNPENTTTLGEGGDASNILLRADTRANSTRIITRKVLASIYGEWEIIAGLKYRITGGVDYNVGSGDFFQEAIAFDGITPRSSLLVQERPIELTTNLSHTLTYNKVFGDHSLTVLVGEEETNFRFDKVRLQGNSLFNSKIQFASTGSTVAAANEADQWALRGFLGRVNYSYKGKYLFTANVRNDNTSRFAKGNRSQTFPSFSAGWRISEESFFPKGNVFDDLKIRGSWGQSGNQFTGANFAFLSTLKTTIFYPIGTGQVPMRGLAPVNFTNENLRWETSNQLDIGTDISLLRSRIEITADYYRKITKDVLIGLPIPFTSGYFLAADANVGEILNRGIELAVNYRNRIGEVSYSLGGNITTVHNEVLDLGNITEIITGVSGASTHRTTVGEPLGYLYGYKTDGIYQTQAEVDAALPDAFSSDRAPGDIRFVDVNKDGRVDALDRTKIGNPNPRYFYGINGSASYKGFDLTLLLQGVGGIEVYNEARVGMESMTGANNSTTRVLDRWTEAGSSNTMPRAVANDPNGNGRYSDRWIENASFMRIKNLQIGYALPTTKLQGWTKEFVSKARIYVAAQNLYTFTKYLGFDPEVTRGFSFQKGDIVLANGQDPGNSPQPRIYQLGVQVTF
ncbi:SusC/RagA family TonB-linked outer membrane protein [Adhaeribacter pallidiroseus]|uniref:TonB-dependent receptor SusC n=1 Tax=Adhaeribacter pallidiroseus TaxID=2072847 RepID=A0A369QFP1_9BACT|nr:TonB-dependent receptor [Adhaeribacter pallidiroseus]RDC62046.1 TonB-dependent receptor SusC [Adhaeribacter pallidiroseus]